MKYKIVRYRDAESSTRARCVLTDRDVMWGTVVMYRRRRDNIWYCNETFAPLAATIKASLVILRMKQ